MRAFAFSGRPLDQSIEKRQSLAIAIESKESERYGGGILPLIQQLGHAGLSLKGKVMINHDRFLRSRSLNGLIQKRRSVCLEPLEDRRLLAVTFEFNFVGGNAVGFNDPLRGAEFRAAVLSAGDRLGGWLLHDATVALDVISHPFDGTAVPT